MTTRCCSSGWRRAFLAPKDRCARRRTCCAANELGQNSLWPHGISGDLPILLVRVVDDELGIVRQALEAQEYWRLKGLKADLVILNEHPVSYMDEVQSRLTSMLDDGPWRMWKHQPGGAFLLRGRHDGPGRAHAVLRRGARACSKPAAATCARTWRGRRSRRSRRMPLPCLEQQHTITIEPPPWPSMPVGVPALTLANGIGGFADEGRTYAIVLEGDQETPAPWVNVISNPALRHRPQRERIGDHVVGEQPREPPDAVCQRSGRRSRRRGDLHPRRRYRPRVVADAGTDGARWRQRPLPDSPYARASRASRDRSKACTTSSRCSSTTRIRCASPR